MLNQAYSSCHKTIKFAPIQAEVVDEFIENMSRLVFARDIVGRTMRAVYFCEGNNVRDHGRVASPCRRCSILSFLIDICSPCSALFDFSLVETTLQLVCISFMLFIQSSRKQFLGLNQNSLEISFVEI